MHATFIALLLAVFYFLSNQSVVHGPYIYDEADYMYAVSRGFAANYTDSPTLPLPEFLKLGLSRGKDAGRQADLSELIRRGDDMVFYRHWHGPLYVDWLHLLKSFTSDEYRMRAWGYMFPILTALLLYFGALYLLPRDAGQVAAMLGSALFLWSYPVIRTTELAPHAMFILAVVAALLALAKMMQTGERKYWCGAVVLTAVAFCILEVAFALIATLLICGHFIRDRLKPDLRFAAISVVTFLATVMLIWPSAILKLSFIKAYLFMAYLAVFRRAAWGSDISVPGTWWLRLVSSPVPWILLAVAVYLLISRRRTLWSPVLLPFVVYAVSMFLAIFRVNSEFPKYVLPLWPGIVLIAAFTSGLWLVHFKPIQRYATVAAIGVAMVLTTLPHLTPRIGSDPANDSMLALLRTDDLARKSLLVPQAAVPMVHYYFPRAHFKGYVTVSEIPEELRGGSFDGVIYAGNPARYEPRMNTNEHR